MRLFICLMILLYGTTTAHASDQDWKGKHIVDLWWAVPKAMVGFKVEYDRYDNLADYVPVNLNDLTFNASITDDKKFQSHAFETSAYRYEALEQGCSYRVTISDTGIIESIRQNKTDAPCAALPKLVHIAPQQRAALAFARQQHEMFAIENSASDMTITTYQRVFRRVPASANPAEALICHEKYDVPLDEDLTQSCFRKKIFRFNDNITDLIFNCSAITCSPC